MNLLARRGKGTDPWVTLEDEPFLGVIQGHRRHFCFKISILHLRMDEREDPVPEAPSLAVRKAEIEPHL